MTKSVANAVTKAVIPVAGLGTRFLPVTKSLPKELLPIGSRPTLEMVIEEAADSGIADIILISSPQKKLINEYFNQNSNYDLAIDKLNKSDLLDDHRRLARRVKIRVVLQSEPKGLGHAILCAKDAVEDEPFIVILPDVLIESRVPCCKQLVDAYEKVGCSVNATEHTAEREISFYGIYDVARTDGRYHWAKGVVEKPGPEEAPSDFSVVGRYLFTPEVFKILENLPPGKNGEIQLADAMDTLAKMGKMVAYEYEGRQFDTGDVLGFIKANIYYGMRSYPDEIKKFMKGIIDDDG